MAGDSLSALGHPVLTTPTLDYLAEQGTLFANHWANAAPCGPSRACLYTGTYLHRNRSLNNGTPLDDRFTNVARWPVRPATTRSCSVTPTPASTPATWPPTICACAPTSSLPGFRTVLYEPWEEGSQQWGRWLAAQGVDVPANPQDLYLPMAGFAGADQHGSTWAPARFTPEQSETAFMVEALTGWLDENGDEPFFIHASFIRPHPPRRNPIGYHDLYDADDLPPFVGAPTKAEEAAAHPFNGLVMYTPMAGAPEDEGSAASYGPPTTVPKKRSTTSWPGSSTTSTPPGWRRRHWWS